MTSHGSQSIFTVANLTAYTENVKQFGSSKPYLDKEGCRYNLRHETVFGPDAVKTNGMGDVIVSPLLWKKPCFGRPERFFRCQAELGSQYMDQNGKRQHGDTIYDRCPVREACELVSFERIESDINIKTALDTWNDALDGIPQNRWFLGRVGLLWQKFLRAVIVNGGWFNINDDQVKLDIIQRNAADKAKDREARRALRKRRRDVRRGTAKPITIEFEVALDAERDRRAAQLKRLRKTKTAGPWLSKIKDPGCDRISDVWRSVLWLERSGEKVTGKAIANHMICHGRSYGLALPSLTTRVLEDRKRILKLEDNKGNDPLWPKWLFKASQASVTP